MTDTQTTTQELSADFLAARQDFKEHQRGSRKSRAPIGAYILQFPQVMTVTIGDKGLDKGAPVIDAEDTTIVADKNGDATYLGQKVDRFFRISGRVQRIPDNRGGGKYTDLDDLLTSFGVDINTLQTLQDYQNAVDTYVAGQQSPFPIYLTITGSHKKTDGKYRRFKPQDFLRADGSYANGVYIDGDEGPATIDPTIPGEVTNEQEKRDWLKKNYTFVFGNMGPGFRAFATLKDAD